MLRDVSGEFSVGGGGNGVGVKEEGAGGRGGSGRKDVEEGGFAGPTRADNGEDLGRVGGEGDVLKNVGRWGGGAILKEEGRCKGRSSGVVCGGFCVGDGSGC